MPVISSIAPSTGELDEMTEIVITGSGFGTNPTLEVYGIASTVLPGASDTEIHAILNLAAATQGPHDVVVTSQGITGTGFTTVQGQQPTPNSTAIDGDIEEWRPDITQ
jgi:hypothetical protein